MRGAFPPYGLCACTGETPVPPIDWEMVSGRIFAAFFGAFGGILGEFFLRGRAGRAGWRRMRRRILTGGAPERSGEFTVGSRRACGGKSLNNRIKSVVVRLGKADDAERDH